MFSIFLFYFITNVYLFYFFCFFSDEFAEKKVQSTFMHHPIAFSGLQIITCLSYEYYTHNLHQYLSLFLFHFIKLLPIHFINQNIIAFLFKNIKPHKNVRKNQQKYKHQHNPMIMLY